MTDPRLLTAIRNNAMWCDTVCRAHRGATVFEPALWRNANRAPRFYPNLITLTPDGARPQRDAIRALEGLGFAPGWGVKDSFAALDLSGDGFALLFSAQWLWRAPVKDTMSDASWRPAAGAGQFAAWERGFARDDPGPPLFPTVLAADPTLSFVAQWMDGAAQSGASLNRHAGVCAIHNIFGPATHRAETLAAIVAQAQRFAPGTPLVHYTTAALVPAWQDLGFAPLGSLRIWVKE